nr:DUF2076 family protein [uncultured Devosia sp.]
MSNQQDKQAIEGLFDRIEDVARNSAPRDRDAENLIQQRLRDYPPAPYYMAQTILIQEQALREARERIEQHEAGRSPQYGWDNQPARARGPWDRQEPSDARPAGGGFLAGAAQTALGVTGGLLLGSAIAGMFAGSAQAEEVQPVDNGDQGQDQDFDAGDDDLGGGFDFGGDF